MSFSDLPAFEYKWG